MRRPVSASRVGVRRPTSHADRGDTIHEDALRAMLGDDPNDSRAFQALAEIVRRRAADIGEDADPLTAPHLDLERQKAADLAVWALAEELAGHPRAWYPLVELARLSMQDDHEGAIRRLTTAAERDTSGMALVDGLAVLREAGLPGEALNLGVGHWRVREHTPAVARELVLAALEADRPLEAKHHLQALDLHPDKAEVAALHTELDPQVTAAANAVPGH